MVTGQFPTKRIAQGMARDRSGNVAMMWALMGTVLIGLVGLTIDFTRAQALRAQMQNAADGAALVAERSYGQSLGERTDAARAFFDAEMITVDTTGVNFSVTDLGDVGHRVDVSMPMQMSLASLVSTEDWIIRVSSEAEQGGVDVEVSVVLDTTGSMAGTKIADLRTAATDLVNTIVSDEQAPYYSRVALVPFAVGVNAGSYAPQVRGSLTGSRSISNAAWANSPQRSISGATRTNPVVITSAGHGFANGDRVRIRSVSGMTQLNNNTYTVTAATAATFALQGVNGSGYSNYSSGGNVTRCTRTNCEVVVTANSHGLATGEYVYITGVNGMTQINNAANATWLVTAINSNSYALNGSNGPTYGAYTSGGSSFCAQYGCTYFRFLNAASNAARRHQASSTCVTERTGANRYTDVAPGGSPVGIMYPTSGNPCGSQAIMPLTSDRAALNARIASLTASGTTAGQIGFGWGWYMLSPNFGSIFSGEGRPANYGAESTLKVAVLMTDGEFNTHYCNGVIARNASSVGSADRINCDAPNGTGFAQAAQICDAMKAQGIVVYTVGFDLGGVAGAAEVLEDCATSQAHFFNADNGAELRSAFQEIARAIQQLRITR
jgi:Flp pilus assembly protein TadG